MIFQIIYIYSAIHKLRHWRYLFDLDHIFSSLVSSESVVRKTIGITYLTIPDRSRANLHEAHISTSTYLYFATIWYNTDHTIERKIVLAIVWYGTIAK